MAQPQKNTTQQSNANDDGEDLMKMLNDESKPKKEYTTATFKATRIVNSHSIENVGKGVLDFRIMHRFGPVNKGISDFFGLDAANTSLGFDYGVTDWLMVGINRSTYQKELQGFTKIKLLRQVDDGKGLPFSVSYMGAMSAQTLPAPTDLPVVTLANGTTKQAEYYFSNRLYYVNQLLIARKFSRSFSLELMPTHVHYNLVPTSGEPNDMIALGIGGRLKLSNRISVTGEYYYRFNELDGINDGTTTQPYHNSVSVGIDIETGGHVFQLMFTNGTATTERAFIGQNLDDFFDGGIHFGFNISRVFTIVKPKGFDASRNKIW
ncbi:MAG: hypothetical protein EOP51_09195 [Sphingobacteriales bacterium]|nr:MAG: hypothetical protein EOP51_09195 [Sphingobacteriales bacterium]